jgi:hypothetical protein
MTPKRIAAAHRVSLRHLYRLWAQRGGSCVSVSRVRHAICATQLKTRLPSPPSRAPGALAIRRTSAADSGTLTPHHVRTTLLAARRTNQRHLMSHRTEADGGHATLLGKAGTHAGGRRSPFDVRWCAGSQSEALEPLCPTRLPALHNLGARCRRLSAHLRS